MSAARCDTQRREDIGRKHRQPVVRLVFCAEGGEEIVKVKSRPGFAVYRQERMLQLAPQSCMKQRRCRNEAPDPSPQRRRSQAPVDAVKSDILQAEGVSGVAGQRLVRAFTRQHHRDSFAGQSGHEIERHAGRPHDRLVLMPDQARQSIEEVLALDPYLVMEADLNAGHGARIRKLAIGLSRRNPPKRSPPVRARRVFVIKAATALESTPPLRKTPRGTSLIRWLPTRLFQQIAIGLDVIILRDALRHRREYQVPILRIRCATAANRHARGCAPASACEFLRRKYPSPER